MESLNQNWDGRTRRALENETVDVPANVQKLLETHENLEGSMYFI
jgi:hypothetical protein